MKKKLFFLLTLLVCCIGQVWGGTAELKSVSTKNVVTKKGESVSLSFGDVTCTVTRNSSNQPGFYTTNGIVRYYSDDVMTLSVPEGGTITNIAFTYTSGGTNHSAGVGTFSSDGNEWTGSANSVSFTGSGTVKINTITVTYTNSVPTDELKSLTVSGTPTKTTYEAGEEFDPAGLTVTGTYTTSGSKTVTSGITWTYDPKTLTAGTTSVSVTAKVGSVESAAYTVNGLTVNAPKTLSSIAVSGTPTKTSYYVGAKLDVAGLVATGTYSDGSTEDLTDVATWNFTPAIFDATGNVAVAVVATVEEISSPAYNVNVTVAEKPAPTYANTYTSGEGLLTTTGGTSASAAKVVIDGTEYDAIKAGTGSVAGKIQVTVPAGTKNLHFHALAWGSETVEITVDGNTYDLTSDSGVASNTPFTLTSDPSEVGYFILEINNAEAKNILFEVTTGKRFVLFGVNAEASTSTSIAADDVEIAADDTSGEIAYTITNPVEGQTLSANTDASWISEIKVTDEKVTFTTTANTGNAERTATITLKYEGADDKDVTVTQAKPVPTYASLAELVAAGEPTTAGEPVNVTLTDEEITKFYVTGSYTNGVYLMVGTQEIEIYCKNVPSDWAIGGTISGTLQNCIWKTYQGTWELCPDNWDALSYTAPAPAKTYTITWSVNGATSTEDVEEGETINFAPATVPAGYTDYVFRGWTTNATVIAEPTYVTEATATADVTYYAVFAKKTTTGGSGNYERVTENQSDWSGDYLIAYSDDVFADGRVGGVDGIGKQSVYVAPGENLSETTVAGTWGDQYNVSLVEIESTGTYLLVTKDGQYNYYTSNSKNGITSTAKLNTAASYPITVNFVSEKDVQLALGGGATGSIFHYNTDGYFRFYRDGGQSPVYLYKKQAGTVTYSDFCTVLPTGLPVVIGDTGYATLYDNKYRIIPTDVKAYYCTEGEEGVLNTVQITEVNYIPRYCGVILEANPGTYYFEETEENTADQEKTDKIEDGVLNGTIDNMSIEEFHAEFGANRPVYVFSKVNDRLGFYKFGGDTLAGRKAFYVPKDETEVNGFTLDFGGQTVGVNSVISATNLKAGYDIQGRKLNKMQKGINILNGKKIIK